MNYYFSHFPWNPKNEATGLKKSEETNIAVFILGWIQLRYTGEGGRNIGSSMLLPGPKPGGDVCHAGRYRRGAEERGSLLPSVALCLALGIQAFHYEVFLDTLCLPLFYCSVASGNEGALWEATCQAPAEGSTSPTNALGLRAPSPHIAICNVYLLTSLLIYVLSLRPEGIIRSPRLIGISMGQRVSLSSYMAE